MSEESADASWPSLPTNQAHEQKQQSHVTKTNRRAQAHSLYAVMLHREESDASWPSLPTNQAHAEKTAMNKNNRDCNVHELGDHLKCQRLRAIMKENLMKESQTYFNQAICVRIIQNGSLKALNSKNTSCVNTNLTTISHVAQCTLFRKFNNNKGCTEVVPRHS